LQIWLEDEKMSCGRLTARDPTIERLSNLLARVGRGDQRAFTELLAATRNKLRKTAHPIAPSSADLDDLSEDLEACSSVRSEPLLADHLDVRDHAPYRD
jgi:hypothetical protein